MKSFKEKRNPFFVAFLAGFLYFLLVTGIRYLIYRTANLRAALIGGLIFFFIYFILQIVVNRKIDGK